MKTNKKLTWNLQPIKKFLKILKRLVGGIKTYQDLLDIGENEKTDFYVGGKL